MEKDIHYNYAIFLYLFPTNKSASSVADKTIASITSFMDFGD